MTYFAEDQDFMSKLKTMYHMGDGRFARRTGRTYAMAKILLETAIESGRTVRIYDHHLDVGAQHATVRFMTRQIERLIEEYKDMSCYLNVSFSENGRAFKASLDGEYAKSVYNYLRIVPYQTAMRNPYPDAVGGEDLELLLIC